MDNKLLSRFQDCISNLNGESKDDLKFELFQDLTLYTIRDVSQYTDIEELQKIYPIRIPLIVGCSGRKNKIVSESLARDDSRNRTRSNHSDENNSVDDKNLYEGQPLEMNVYADLSGIDSANLNSPVFVKKDKTAFIPVRLSYAYRLLSAYSSLMLSSDLVKDKEQMPLLLYCTGEDFYRTVYVYINPITVESKTVLKYVRISVEEAKDVPTITATRLPDLRQLSTLAEYKVYDGSRSYNNAVVERPSRIILEAEWGKSFTFLEKPAPNSKVSVKAKIIPGDRNSPTYPKFQELCVLKGFFEGLGKGEVRWSAKERDDNVVMENLKILFEQLKLGDEYINDDIEKNRDENDIPQNTLVINRKDQDFTDKLWNVLIGCTSYSELIDCLDFMLLELRSKNLQPLVHKTNKTRIAEIVRNSYTNEFCFPEMEGLLPLKLLIEIGIEKLRNDYVSILMANELTTADQLLYYTDRTCTLLEKMERLEKLHSVYELVIMLNFYLKISESTLSFAARMALSHFQKQLLDDNHTFILPVSPASVANFLKSSQPYLWKISLDDPKDQTKCAVYAFFETLPFDHIVMKEDYPEDLSYYLVKLQEHSMML